MKVCVTGATGFVGNALVRRLLDEGFSVRAFCRPESDTSPLDGLDVEYYRGSLFDVDALTDCFRGGKAVFHVAGDISFRKRDWERVYKTNVEGTDAVLKAAQKAGVERLVFTSSTAAVGATTDPDNPADETYLYDGDRYGYTYYQSKYLAEQKVMRFVEDGLDCVVVNPTVALGRYDYKMFTGRFFAAAKKGLLLFAPPGGLNLVDVEDVAIGHILALKHGEKGQRYILGGANLTYQYIFERINLIVGRKRKVIVLPQGAMPFLGRWNDLFANMLKREITLTEEMACTSEYYMYYTSERAQKKLGFCPRNFDETLKNTYDWLRENNLI